MRMRSFQKLSLALSLAAPFALSSRGVAQSVALCTELPPPLSVDTLPLHLGLMVRGRGDQLQQRYSARERAALSSIVSVLKGVLPAAPIATVANTRSRFMQTSEGAKRFTPVVPGDVIFTLGESGNITELRVPATSVDAAADSVFGAALQKASGAPALQEAVRQLGGKPVRLEAFLSVRVPQRDGSLDWVQTLIGTAAMPVYEGTLAVLRPGTQGVRYPEALRAAGKQGNVLSQAVISATGEVERNSLTILRADEPEFAEEVRSWMLRTTFIPATIGGCAVRSLVQSPMGFSIHR